MSIENVSRQIAELSAEFKSLNTKFDNLDAKVDQGFNDSKVRDEEQLALTRFGLEAVEVVSDSVNRRFDESDRKHDEQIGLLKDVLRQKVTKP